MKIHGKHLAGILEVTVPLLPLIAIIGAYVLWSTDKANAAVYAATMIGIWVAVLAALQATRTTQHQMLVELLRALQSPSTLKAIAMVGAWYDQECDKLRKGTWALADHVGFRYLIAARQDQELHASRREAAAVYETVCSLVLDGTVAEALATAVFPNLRRRAATFTVVEEFLSLDVTARRFTERPQELQVLWNTSREEKLPSEATTDIEVGKRSMRSFSGLCLVLHPTETKVDYSAKILRLAMADLLGLPSHLDWGANV